MAELFAPSYIPLQLLVTTNDSRVRIYDMDDYSQLYKFKGAVAFDVPRTMFVLLLSLGGSC